MYANSTNVLCWSYVKLKPLNNYLVDGIDSLIEHEYMYSGKFRTIEQSPTIVLTLFFNISAISILFIFSSND